MTTELRALCAELLAAWDSYGYADAGDATDRTTEAIEEIRAALSEQPAGPIDEKPEFTAEEVEMIQAPWSYLAPAGPSDEEMWDLYYELERDPIKLARAILQRWGRPAPQPEQPAGPSREDFQAAYDAVCWGKMDLDNFIKSASALLSRFGRPAPQPIPVAERLPGPGDCDAQGRCWWWIVDEPGQFPYWIYAQDEVVAWAGYQAWLPAHALPLPGTDQQEGQP